MFFRTLAIGRARSLHPHKFPKYYFTTFPCSHITTKLPLSILKTFPQHLYPVPWPSLLPLIQHHPSSYNSSPSRLVVLDDDPTGCQTMYDINVLLRYDIETLATQLRLNHPIFYILTNTRAMSEEHALCTTRTVIQNLLEAKKRVQYPYSFQFISRGDSTLRGHFPAEVETIVKSADLKSSAMILLPAFFEGGRVTINSTHYLTEKNELIPVGLTPFASDPHFGYRSSNLREWVLEKSNGRIKEQKIHSITLTDLREGGPDIVSSKLRNLFPGDVMIVDTIEQMDLNVFVSGLLQSESSESPPPPLIFRTAASFVATRSGLPPKPLLTKTDILHKSSSPSDCPVGGLIVVGSYVPKTTAQLEVLLSYLDILPIEFDVEHFSSLLSLPNPNHATKEYVSSLSSQINTHIASGKHVVIFTSRKLPSSSASQDISFHKLISDSLTAIVSHLSVKPSFLIAKGGITSNDVASIGLNISSAVVLGQIDVGVPVWRTGQESRFPGMNYIVFPGNVGSNESLSQVAEKLGVPKKQNNQAAAELFKASEISHLRSVNQTFQLLHAAKTMRSKATAVAAFNVYNLEGAKAVVDAAQELQSPVILQIHPSSLSFGGKELLSLLSAYRQTATIPVSLHLDHITDEADLLLALEMKRSNGKPLLDSVMVDGSAFPLEENINWTARMASYAHQRGVVVEAELGRLAGEEDGLSIPEVEAKMTDPDVVEEFLTRTQVDMLAVTIGNVHGKYSRPPALDFLRLHRILRAVEESSCPNLRSTHLVLHGASGLPSSLIHRAIAEGQICKLNVNTDLREAALSSMRKAFADEASGGSSGGKRVDVLALMKGSYGAMKAVAREKISLFRGEPGEGSGD